MNQKLTIGRKDKADFPELKLKNIDIKIDTGAYTSSFHCHHIEERVINNKRVIKFELLDPSHSKYKEKEFTTESYKEKQIKNSFGKSEKRFIINTVIKLFETEFPIELSLSERGEMKYPVLIGRQLLVGKFLVDPSKYNLSYKMKIKFKDINKLKENI